LKRARGAVAVAAALAGACSGSPAKKDGGSSPGLCANGAFTPSGSFMCADTFDAQAMNPTRIAGTTASGMCGGSLVWLVETPNWEFACVYDPTTKMLTGAVQFGDTGGTCSGDATKLPNDCIRAVTYADGGTTPPDCTDGSVGDGGGAACADTFAAQVMAPQGGAAVGGGWCGGYVVWLVRRSDSVLTCIYDETVTMRLVGTRLESATGTPCSGVGTTLPLECSDPQTLADAFADAGLRGCAGPFAMEGAMTCADTFDDQVANPTPHAPNQDYVASGACGGYLVWFNTGMLYDFTCVYDPTTRKLVGARSQGDTPGAGCSGAGRDLPLECSTRDAHYGDAGASD
jgi:hypothetical protein